MTRFVWLAPVRAWLELSSANRLLDRLEYLQRIDLPEDLLAGVPAHRVTRLRRQGERVLCRRHARSPEDRRLDLGCLRLGMAGDVGRRSGRNPRPDRRSSLPCFGAYLPCKGRRRSGVVRDTLKSFAEIGAPRSMHRMMASRWAMSSRGVRWDGKTLVAMATGLTATMADDPLNHVLDGYHRFRRYAPRMLRLLDLRAAPVALPLLEAVTALRTGLNDAAMTSFLRPSSKWHRHLQAQRAGDARLWGDRGAVPSARCVPLRRCLALLGPGAMAI